MIIIAVIDDRNGLLFNKRRQSQDYILYEKILELTSNSCLWMNSYSSKQFAQHPAQHLTVDDEFLDKASEGEYCFIENVSTLPYLSKIEKIILYKWNRKYPGDFFFDIPLEQGWKITEVEDFPGSSHENMTKEVYERVS